MRSSVITIVCLLVFSRGAAEDPVKGKDSALQMTEHSNFVTSHHSGVINKLLMPAGYTYSKENTMQHSNESRKVLPLQSTENFNLHTQDEILHNIDKLSDTIVHTQTAYDYYIYNKSTTSKRNKREAEETEIPKEYPSDENPTEPETLPEAESLTWVRPARVINQGMVRNVNAFTKVPSPLPINYQNRQSHRNVEPPYGNRPHPGHISSKPNYNQQINLMQKHDPFSSNTGYGSSHGINNIPRQHYNNDYQSTPYPSGPRFREISGYSPQNNYPLSTYPPRGYGGGSIFDLLNPLNLFRVQVPPALPRNPSPIPQPNAVPPLNGYDPRQPRQPPKRPVPNNSFEGRNPPGEFDFTIDYEIVEDDIEHDYGHEFWKESNIREDIYVGKDGNLYVREDNSGKRGNSERQSQSGNNRRPSNRPSYSNPNRPGISHPRDRVDDIDDINVDGKAETNGEAIYKDLLKNHNMKEEPPKELKKTVEEYFDENSGSFETLSQNLNSLLDYEDYYDYDYDETNQVLTSTSRPGRPSATQNWTPTRPRLINYPSYYYAPKHVSVNTLNRARPWRTLTGSRRRTPQMTSIRQTKPYPSHPNQMLHSTSQMSSNYANLANLLNSNTETGYKDRGKPRRPQAPSQIESSRIQEGDGFYPGNGFFDADFQTLFHMASQRKRGVNSLPTPLAQNGTTVALLLNSTATDSLNSATTADDLLI